MGLKMWKDYFSLFIFLCSFPFHMAHDIRLRSAGNTSSEFIKRLLDVEVIKGQPINFHWAQSSYHCIDAASLSIFL
jgi:hypothetical protein